MNTLKIIKTSAEALSEIEQLSRLKFMTDTLYTNYWEAGKWHDEKERKAMDRIITDIRAEAALLLERKKRDYAEAPMALDCTNGRAPFFTSSDIVA